MGVPLNYSKSLILDWDFPLYKPTSQPAIGVALSMAPPQMSYGCGNTFFFVVVFQLGRGWSSISQSWLVVWNMICFSIYWEYHHPTWRAHISNQSKSRDCFLEGTFFLLHDLVPGLCSDLGWNDALRQRPCRQQQWVFTTSGSMENLWTYHILAVSGLFKMNIN